VGGLCQHWREKRSLSDRAATPQYFVSQLDARGKERLRCDSIYGNDLSLMWRDRLANDVRTGRPEAVTALFGKYERVHMRVAWRGPGATSDRSYASERHIRALGSSICKTSESTLSDIQLFVRKICFVAESRGNNSCRLLDRHLIRNDTHISIVKVYASSSRVSN